MHLEIDDEALAKVSEARDYYAAVRPELGREFVAEVDRAISRVVANPLTWSLRRQVPDEGSLGLVLEAKLLQP
jgi:hypothetical protein